MNFVKKTFSNMPILETERLCLRNIQRSDRDDINEYASNPKTTKYLLWDTHKTMEYTKTFLKIVLAKYKSGEYYDWGIVYKGNHKLIGTCGFTKIDMENRVAEIGYVINPVYWNMGIASEACKEVLRFAFDTLNMHRVEAKFMQGNDASLAVMKKIGMTFEGYRRDLMFVKGEYKTIGTCSILETEYHKKQTV